MKQKRIKIIVLSALLGFMLFAGGGVTYLAYAEEASEMSSTASQNDEDSTMDDTPEEAPESVEDAEKEPILDVPAESDKEEIKESMEPVISGLAGLAGAALLFLSFTGTLGKLKESFDSIVKWFKAKGEELVGEEVDIKNLQEGLKEAVASNTELKNALELLKDSQSETYESVMNAVNSLVESFKKTVVDMQSTYVAQAEEVTREYKQIKDALIKLLAGEPTLVRSGVADAVIKELENDTKAV